MGLLDQIEGLAGRSAGNDGADPKAALVQSVLGMLVHGNEPGGLGGSGGLGGLSGLLQRFETAGLGAQVASWIGAGPNAPVTADQVRAALGDGPLRTLAEHAGVDESTAATHLTSILPQIIDRLTPSGQVPTTPVAEDHLAGAIESFSHLFTGRPA